MKNLLYIFTLAILLTSCEKEDIEISQENTQLEKSISTGGFGNPTTYFAGYGWDPVDGEARGVALQTDRQLFSFSPVQKSIVSIDVVDNFEDLEQIFERKTEFSINFNIPGAAIGVPAITNIGFGFDQRKELIRKMKFTSNTVSVVARVIVPFVKQFEGRIPRFEREALLELKKYGEKDFIENYGAGWVQSETYGAEAIFVYTYTLEQGSYTNINRLMRNLRVSVEPYFGVSSGIELNEEERLEIKRLRRTESVTWNLPGYTPIRVDDINEGLQVAEGMRNKMDSYLSSGRPDFIPTLSQNIESYGKAKRDLNEASRNKLDRFYRNAARCKKVIDSWEKVRLKVLLVNLGTTRPSIKNKTDEALRIIDNKIERAKNCDNSVPLARPDSFNYSL